MRSISSKLILAFLSIGIASVAILFTTARSNTKTEFVRFLSDQTKKDIIGQLSIYHLKNGSWDGVESIFLLSKDPNQPGFADIQPCQEKCHLLWQMRTEMSSYQMKNIKVGERVPTSDLTLWCAHHGRWENNRHPSSNARAF